MNNNRNKTHELVIDINPRNRETIISDTTFFSMDANTGEKVIRFTRNHQAFDLTGVAVLIGFHFIDKDASKIIDSEDGSVQVIDATSGQCRVEVPSHVYDYEGDVMVHVYLKFENGQSLDCGIIATRFERSWLDKELPEMDKFYVQRFEDLAREIRERVEALHQLLDDVEGSLVNRSDFNNHVNDRNNPHGITTSQIGAATANHLHNASDIHAGVLNIARIPTGTTATTVAVGNHTHEAISLTGVLNHVGISAGIARIGDLIIETGTISVTIPVPNIEVRHTITFRQSFRTNPTIIVSPVTSSPWNVIASMDQNSPVDFRMTVRRSDITTTVVRWVAIGAAVNPVVTNEKIEKERDLNVSHTRSS